MDVATKPETLELPARDVTSTGGSRTRYPLSDPAFGASATASPRG